MEAKRNQAGAGQKSDARQCTVKLATVSAENTATCVNQVLEIKSTFA